MTAETRTFFVVHIGAVTVNDHGTVEWTDHGSAYRDDAHIIMHADTLYEIAREVRAALREVNYAAKRRERARISRAEMRCFEKSARRAPTPETPAVGSPPLKGD